MIRRRSFPNASQMLAVLVLAAIVLPLALSGRAVGAALRPTAAVVQHTFTAPVDRDTTITTQNETPWGAEQRLYVLQNGGSTSFWSALMRFDLAVVPPGSRVISATANFYMLATDSTPISVHRVTAAWDEAAATWSTIGSQYDATPAASFAPTGRGRYVQVDVTPLTQAWLAGAHPNHGILLKALLPSSDHTLMSKEAADPAQWPYLEIVVEDARLETVADDFDPNTGYSGSDGDLPWRGPWEEIAETDGPDAGAVRTELSGKCATGACLRVPGLRSDTIRRGVSRGVNLTGATGASLSFTFRSAGRDGQVDLEASADGGAHWTRLKAYVISATASSHMGQSFNLLPYAAPNTRIRFVSAGTPSDGWLYVDNVRVDVVRQGIGGRVWDDLDRDGAQDPAEPGSLGVTVNLYNSSCAAATGAAYRTTVTGSAGYYAFTPLAAGAYCVRVDAATLPFGYALTTSKATVDVMLAAAQYYGAANFGYAAAVANDRLSVGAYAPCVDATWLQALTLSYGATIINQNPAACSYTVQTPPANLTALQAAIVADPHARHAVPDSLAHAMYTPNDPDYNNAELVYGPQAIHADGAWDVTRGDPTVLVAVLDTGLDLSHGEFVGRVLPGYDFVNSDSDPSDDQHHGTHVTGILGAGINNGIGIAGIAGDARLLPVKVLNANASGWWSNIARGITWAVDQGARVVNLSVAGTSYSQALYDAVAYANSKGAVVVVAAGNNGTDLLTYPAAFDNVVAVGATDYDGTRAFFSNYGPNVDVMAPGGSIWSSYPGGGYAYMSGTSMAAPHAAGVAALLLSVNPNLTAAQIKALLQSTATDLDAPGVDALTGYGLINAQAAVAAVTPAVFVTPTTRLTATLAVDVNGNGLVDPGDTLRYLVTVANGGTQPLSAVVVSATVPLYTSYVISDTKLNSIPVRDDALPQTALPLDESGLNIGTVAPLGSSVVSFDVVVGQPPRGVYAVVGQATVQAGAGSQILQTSTSIAGTLLQAAVDQTSAQIGQMLTYSFATDYLGSGLLSNAVVTAVVPAGTNFVSANAGGTQNGGVITWNLGSSVAGVPGYQPADVVTVIITATQDSWIDGKNPSNTHGGETTFHLRPETINNEQAFIQFDLASVPFGVTITDANLRLQQIGMVRDNGAEVLGVYTLTSHWDEATVNWSTKPAMDSTWLDPKSVSTKADLKTWNVLSLVQAWYSGTLTNHGMMVGDAAGLSGARSIYDFSSTENSSNPAPQLAITYPIPVLGNIMSAAPTLVTAGSPITVTMTLTQTGIMTTTGIVNTRVSASSDDAEEEGPEGTNLGPGSIYINSTDLEMAQDMEPAVSGTQKIGMRFNNIGVPKGATITNATIIFRAVTPDSPNTNNGATSLTIRGQAADNPNAFTSTRWDITNRITTTASVAWSPAAWIVGADYSTPNLGMIVQEIVNRSGWANGNSMVFIVTGTGSRSAASYDGSPSTVPLLQIVWQLPPAPAIPGPLTITATNGVTATRLSGPTPISATVGITDTTFTWVYQASSPAGAIGQLTFGGAAAGGGHSWPQAQSNSVLAHPRLTFGATVAGAPAGGGPIRTTGFIRDAGGRLPASASNTPTTGLYGSIGHRVWNDTDGDGIQDAGELGVADVTVQLTASSGSVRTAPTDANGLYDFRDLLAGVYTVTVDAATVPPEFEILTTRYPVVVNLHDGENSAAADVGLKTRGVTVGDMLWYDADADGLQDAGEPGIGNVTLALYRDNDDGRFNPDRDLLVDTTTSDASGAYRLNAPLDGVYFVYVTDPAGILANLQHTFGPQSRANPTPPLTLARGQFNRDVDFGYVYVPPADQGVIGDLVWADGNGDGVRESWEPVLIGVTVCAAPTAGGAAICAASDSNGRYLLVAPAGAYSITPSGMPAGLRPSTLHPLNVNLTAGQQQLAVDFGFAADGVPLGGIGGIVWQDLPTDEVLDGVYTSAVEPGIPEVSVGLIRDLDGGGTWNGTEPYIATFTTVAGTYQFAGLPAGGYLVRVTDTRQVLRRFAESVPGPLGASGADHQNKTQPYAVSLPPGGVNTTADFGYREYDAFGATEPPPPGVIGNLVWLDTDADGQYEPEHSDLPLPGVTVDLLASDGQLLATTTTGADGAYLFAELARGVYAVRVSDAFGVLAAFIPTVVSLAPSQDNTNRAQPYTVTLGLNPVTYLADFGYMRPAVLGDCVYFDVNQNGLTDAGEPGIPDVTLDVYSGGVKVASPTTDAAGMYTVTAPADTYTITLAPAELAPGGTLSRWTPTAAPTTPVTLSAGQALLTADFGLTISSSYTLTQRLNTPAPLRPGELISYTIRITNTGATWLAALSLTDLYSPTYLTYGFGGVFASPDSDDHVSDGLITWTDVLSVTRGGPGMLAPGASLAVTVTFTGRSDTHAAGSAGAPTLATVQNGRFDPDGPGGSLSAQAVPSVPPASADAYVQIFTPTGLPISGFRAAAGADGVTLTWQTSTEAQFLGFNVLHKLANGAYRVVNPELIIAAHSGANAGATYSLRDAGAPAGSQSYLLEVLWLDGRMQRVGPVKVTVAP